MTYFETLAHGRWNPNTSAEAPTVKDGRLSSAGGGVGPKVRSVKDVPPELAHLTLDQMHNIFSPDGNLQATGANQ